MDIKIMNSAATFDEIADYSERAVDYFIDCGAEDKQFFHSGCNALFQVSVITIILMQSKGGMPQSGEFLTNHFNILSCCQAILNLREWHPDSRFPWSRDEMGKSFLLEYGDLFMPMKLEIPEIQKLMRQVSAPDPMIASGPARVTLTDEQ